MEFVLAFFKKLFSMIGNSFTYIVGVILAAFNVSLEEGLMNKMIVLFTIMTIAILGDFLIKFIHVLFISRTERVQSKKIATTISKLAAVYFPFLTIAVIALVACQAYPVMAIALEGVLFAFTTLVVSRELLSLLETADQMGLPAAQKIMEMINNLPDLLNIFKKKGGN